MSKTFQVISLTVAGFVSGILTILANRLLNAENFSFGNVFGIGIIFPGILFGIGIILYAITYQKEKITLGKSIKFILVSLCAYAVAFYVTVAVSSMFPAGKTTGAWSIPTIGPAGFIIGGLIGAFILTLGIQFLLFKLSPAKNFCLIILGAVLGFVGFIACGSNSTFDPLFMIWQTGMALVLGLCLV